MPKNADEYKYGYDCSIIIEINQSHSDSQEELGSRFRGKNISFLGSNISQTEDEIIINRVILDCYRYVTFSEDDETSFVDNLEFVFAKLSQKAIYFSNDEIIIVDGIIKACEKNTNINNSSILRIYLENSFITRGSFGFGYSM